MYLLRKFDILLYSQSPLLKMALSFVLKCMTVVFTSRFLRFLKVLAAILAVILNNIKLLKGDKVASFIYRFRDILNMCFLQKKFVRTTFEGTSHGHQTKTCSLVSYK